MSRKTLTELVLPAELHGDLAARIRGHGSAALRDDPRRRWPETVYARSDLIAAAPPTLSDRRPLGHTDAPSAWDETRCLTTATRPGRGAYGADTTRRTGRSYTPALLSPPGARIVAQARAAVRCWGKLR